ncbi:MAG: tetratricopeptide repeat protein, partial [bacterium]|nr:tetratricopeptide repeat protein [bacterium]
MPNARDDNDRVHKHRKRRDASPIFAPVEEIGEMHFSTENYSTAIEYFQKALESSDLNDYPDRYRVLLRIADCHERKGGHREAHDALSLARATISEDTPDLALGGIEFREASILQAQGDYDDALRLGFGAYRKLKHSSEHKEVADIQKLLANCYHRLGQTSEAEEFYMDALSSYRRVEDKKGIAIVYNNLGLVHKNACRWKRALASLNKSLELSESLGLTQQQIWVH